MLEDALDLGQAWRHRAIEFTEANPRVRVVGIALHLARRKHFGGQLQHTAQHTRFTDDVDNVSVVHAVLRTDDYAVFPEIRLDEFAQPARVVRFRREEHDIELLFRRRQFTQMVSRDRRL